MTSTLLTRRDFSVCLASFFSVFAGTASGAVYASGGRHGVTGFVGNDEISHTAEAVHQEVVFNASRKRVYEALSDARQFDRVVQLSEAGMSRGAKPTMISPAAGGAFSLFGGYIVGRNIELAPNERLVQAWREISWPPGVYSIVKFELMEQGTATNLILDHRGFPEGAAKHLAIGWKANYWEPLKKYLA